MKIFESLEELCIKIIWPWAFFDWKKTIHFFLIFQLGKLQVFKVYIYFSLNLLGISCYVPLFVYNFVKLDILSLPFRYLGKNFVL